MLTRAVLCVLSILPWGCPAVLAQNAAEGFRVELAGVRFSAREIRPGDAFSMEVAYANRGATVAPADYRVFVHFEHPQPSCDCIVWQDDHAPSLPTSAWGPGDEVVDGPRVLTVPATASEGEVHVHLGLFDQDTGRRVLDTREAGTIRVSRSATPSGDLGPEALDAAEVAERAAALAERVANEKAIALEGPGWRFAMAPETGAWQLTDAETGAAWTSNPTADRFGQITLRNGDRRALCDLTGPVTATREGDAVRVVMPVLRDGEDTGVRATVTLAPDAAGLAIRCTAADGAGWDVEGVRLLEDALAVTEAEAGRLYVPQRLGVELLASGSLPGVRQWRAYDGLSMAMCGAEKNGSALLVSWDDVDAVLSASGRWIDHPQVAGRRVQALSLEAPGSEAACLLAPVGRGDYVEIARAYRAVARRKGWLKPWTEKREDSANVDRFIGAANFKPFVFSRVLPSSRFSDGEERTHLGFTFDEIAQCAEHWRNDLGIDRASVVLAGWIEGGYDVRHPDPLPAAPECGGNEALQAAAERIRACGYLFGLHDNYQDMYEDAPSWGLEWLNKDASGKPKMGGNWNGGQAWQVCAIKQVELAARERTNLPEIARLFAPSIYFIDTVFAWPLVTCEDPAHPMTRQDDLVWKTRLCMLAKEHFGLFGSEEGREWAVPCSDYLEGIFGHQTDSPPGAVIPLFPLVYSDCVQIMTHQGNRIGAGDAKKMLDHILFAEMQLPQFGERLYWRAERDAGLGVAPLAPIVESLGDRRFAITYRWRVDEKPPADLRVFVHFLHPRSARADGIGCQNDHAPTTPSSQWEPGSIVLDGPHTVEIPAGLDGPTPIGVGFLRGDERVPLAGLPSDGYRYSLGTLEVADEKVRYGDDADAGASALWSRADGGWGERLCTTDRVIKNAWEVLSPLNLLTADEPLSDHAFLNEERTLQRTRFGDLTITANYGPAVEVDGAVLPKYGFLVRGPTFIAYCATRCGGLDYASPTLFTARSLDGAPIAESDRVRVYHGFGDPRIALGGKVFEVRTEEIVSVR